MKKGLVDTPVYIYGDSYADLSHNSNRSIKHETWLTMLKKKFPNTTVYGKAGTGPENQLLKLQKNVKNYHKDSVLIFFVSDPLRFSLVDLYKSESQEYALANGQFEEYDSLTKWQKLFLKHIILHYQSPELNALRYAYIYSTIFALHEKFSNILIWPCFDTREFLDSSLGLGLFLSQPKNVTVVRKDLHTLSLQEFNDEKSQRYVYEENWPDARANHFSAANHEIIYNEVTKWILDPSHMINIHNFKKGIIRYDSNVISNGS